MKKLLLLISFIVSGYFNCFAQLPNTDIWLLDIQLKKDSIILTNPLNITNRVGYDNQPSFSPDGKYILYTAIRDEKQSDIYKYDLKTKTISQFTNTATSEYSPTFMPDGKNISVVMVEKDSTQRLWKFPLKGGEPSLVMDKIDSIGYHCWLDNNHVALFLITQPFKLIFTDITTQKSQYICDTIGRTLKYIKTKKGFCFYYLYKNNIYSIDEKGNKKKFITYLSPKVEDFCLFKKDETINADGAIIYHEFLYGWRVEDGTVEKLIDLSSYGITNITRIAISPDGKKMAIVAELK
jgi:tricorn protease-like protein